MFDCDGLLLETETCWTRAEEELFGRYGRVFGADEKRALIGTSLFGGSQILERLLEQPGRADELGHELLDLVERRLLEESTAFPGAAELVRELRGRTPVAVASNTPERLVRGALVRAGVAGLIERLVRVVYEDDTEVRRIPVLERVLRQAVDEVVIAARPAAPQISLLPVPSVSIPGLPPGGPELPVRRVVNMVATAYDPGPISTGKSPGHPAYGITATGMRATYGVVAVDPRVIPFYSRLYVPGYGYAIAADTGADIKGNRIDLYYPTYGEAIQWGRKTVPVYILE